HLNDEQQVAVDQITLAVDQAATTTFLLEGVTGSGKTEVYLQSMAAALAQGKTALMLVPEISLTPQMVQRVKGRFGKAVAVLHSGLSSGEKYDEWR
ncbi:DEAD/DEAH box helicase family protein, partial [Klebsiella pneumoniae]|nr:DEAD/DEAH box helicase family protein [Klebsiella pneumoniae]